MAPAQAGSRRLAPGGGSPRAVNRPGPAPVPWATATPSRGQDGGAGAGTPHPGGSAGGSGGGCGVGGSRAGGSAARALPRAVPWALFYFCNFFYIFSLSFRKGKEGAVSKTQHGKPSSPGGFEGESPGTAPCPPVTDSCSAALGCLLADPRQRESPRRVIFEGKEQRGWQQARALRPAASRLCFPPFVA